jgi:hypothetical protein
MCSSNGRAGKPMTRASWICPSLNSAFNRKLAPLVGR